MADVSVQNERINGWIPSSATNVILNWPERIKTQPHDDRDNCFLHFDSKGPCGMTVNNDIDDDSATKHGDSHTRTAMWSLETEMSHNLPTPRTASRCRASQECCSMTKKTRPSYSPRVGHLHVARTSTYLRTRRFPSAVVSFSFEKTVLTHISCRDSATVNTIFLSSEIAGFTSSLAKPVHESVPLVMQRFDSLSKHVTKHTRLDCDDDARSS